jgi:hypothetical protein
MDYDKIERLLNIVDKARQWPLLRKIHDAAMKELEAMGAPPPVEAPPVHNPYTTYGAERSDGMPTPTPMGVTNAT